VINLLKLNLTRFARDRLVHFSSESNWLLLQLLWVFSTFNALNVQLCSSSFRKADKVDCLLSHFIGIRVMRALDNRLLGDADLVFLVDVGVFLDGMTDPLLSLKNLSCFSFLGCKLHTPFLKFSNFLVSSLGKRFAFIGFGSVRFSKKPVGGEDASLGTLEVSSFVLVVVTTETTVGSISSALLLNNDSLSLVSDSVVRSVNLNFIIIRPVGCHLIQGRAGAEGDLLMLPQRNLLSINLNDKSLNLSSIGFRGSDFNLGFSFIDGNMLLSIHFLGKNSIFRVFGTVR